MDIFSKDKKKTTEKSNFNKSDLDITLGSFDVCFELQDAVTKAIKGNSIAIPNSMDEEFSPSGFIDAALGTISSKEVRSCLFNCSTRATYRGAQVNQDFFEKEENRELYYPIMVEILTKNIGPFIKGLLSLFGGVGDLLKNYLKSK